VENPSREKKGAGRVLTWEEGKTIVYCSRQRERRAEFSRLGPLIEIRKGAIPQKP